MSFKKDNLHLELLSWTDKWKGLSASFALLLGNLRLYKSSLHQLIIHHNFIRYNKNQNCSSVSASTLILDFSRQLSDEMFFVLSFSMKIV